MAHVELSREASRCFAGMFNGCRGRGVIFTPDKNDHLSIGKAECEWDWRRTWGELKEKGLIDFREEHVACHDGSRMVYVHLSITQEGYDWREEDLRQWRKRMDEIQAEEEANQLLRDIPATPAP